MSERKDYYCGPSKMFPKWLRKLTTPLIFNNSCYMHDCAYAKKLSIKQALRFNKWFYCSMIISIKKSDKSSFSKFNYVILAILYYTLVNLFVPLYYIGKWVWMKNEEEDPGKGLFKETKKHFMIYE